MFFLPFLSSGVNPHLALKFPPLFYTEHFRSLSSRFCLSWKRRNWREISGFRGVGVGESAPCPLWGHEFPRDGVREGKELVWNYLGHIPPQCCHLEKTSKAGSSGVDPWWQDLRKTNETWRQAARSGSRTPLNCVTQLVALEFSVAWSGNDFGLSVKQTSLSRKRETIMMQSSTYNTIHSYLQKKCTDDLQRAHCTLNFLHTLFNSILIN